MSQENVETVRKQWTEYHQTGEWGVSGFDQQIEIHDHDIPDAPVYRGHDGFARWVENWASPWEQFSMDPQEFIDAGDLVVVVFRMTATGAGSVITLERRDAIVYEVKDETVVRLDYFNNRGQALEAVGLSE